MDEQLAEEIIGYIRSTLDGEAERHYSNFIVPKGECPYERYRRNWGQYETDLIQRIQKLVLTSQAQSANMSS